MDATGRLKDGTAFRRWAPPLPLDERWTAPADPSLLAIRDKWVSLRSSLLESGGLDQAIHKLVAFWGEHRVIPRTLIPEGAHETLLLRVAVDAAVAASAKTNIDVAKSLVPEDTRNQVAEMLAKYIRQNSDPTPM